MTTTVAEGRHTTYPGSSWLPLGRPLRVVSEASARHYIDTFYFIQGADHFTVCRAENPDSPVITKLTEFICNALKIRESGTSILDTFKREIEGGEDGYFVSRKWLLSLEEHESDSLMSLLWRAGYSEACQTTTTILFARSENHTSREDAKKSVRSTDIEEVGAPEVGDDLLRTAAKGLTTDKNNAIAHDVDSDNLVEEVEASSWIGYGRNSVNTSPAEWQASTLTLFKVALKSGSQQSFCVSTRWLFKLKDQEKKELETLLWKFGYKMTSQTKTTTWYERIQGCCATNQAVGTSDATSSNSSNENDAPRGEAEKSVIATLFGFLGLKRKIPTEDSTSNNSCVANAKRLNSIQEGNSTCHPQVLRVECTSSICRTPGERLQNGDFYRQGFYDTVGKWPVSKSEKISSTLERSFGIPTLTFLTDERGIEVARQVHTLLKALATISLSRCIGNGHHPPKIRIKFCRIFAEVKNEDPDEESCNALVLSYICTNVYSPDGGGQIFLNLEDDCKSPPGRVLANAQHSWLGLSGITPDYCEPWSTSLVLQSANAKRRRYNSGRVDPLLFQETRPAIFEGTMNSDLDLNSFLNFHTRQKLEISYFRPRTRPSLDCQQSKKRDRFPLLSRI